MINQSVYFVPFMFGENSSKYVGIKAHELGITKALVVCDKGIKDAGIVDPLLEDLSDSGIETVLYDKVVHDPPVDIAEEAGHLADDEKVDGVIGIGGGSSMDTAKTAAILPPNGFPVSQWLAPTVPPNPMLPIILIPTTAGTGSEVSNVAILTDTSSNEKIAINNEKMYADLAIVDPMLYLGMPVKGSVSCGFDAYSHALDSFCSTSWEAHGSVLAREAIRLLHISLPKIISDPQNVSARADVALAATIAGYAMNSNPPSITHQFGHTLGPKLHIPHGVACGVCMPQIIKKYADWIPERVLLISSAMGLDLDPDITNDDLGITVSNHLRGFMKSCGLPTLKEYGITKEEVLGCIQDILGDMTVAVAPRPLREKDCREILEDAYDQY